VERRSGATVGASAASAAGVETRWLVGAEETGAHDGALLLVEYAPGASHELHRHANCECAILALSGSGLHLAEGAEVRQGEGDAVFVAPGEWHGFRNDGDVPAVTLHLFGGAASLEEAGFEPRGDGGAGGPAQPVKKVELSATPEDTSLREGDGWHGLHVRWLVHSGSVGARLLTMNVTVFDPGGAHELHRHARCEEILYFLEGAATHLTEDGEIPVAAGDATFVGRDEWHGLRNDSDALLRVVGCYAGAGSLDAAGYEVARR
jgi:quercetin dioxygenase-like cupin family protein